MNKESLHNDIENKLFWAVYIALMFVNLFCIFEFFCMWRYIATDFVRWSWGVIYDYGRALPYYLCGLVFLVIDVEVAFIGSWLVYKRKKYALWIMAIPLMLLIVFSLIMGFQMFDWFSFNIFY